MPVPEPRAPTVAVIGGGQLARMLAEPAAALGIPLRLLAEAPGASAAQVIPDHVVGDYRDLDTLVAVTDGCAVVTFDHEHVPTDHLRALAAAGVPCRPGPDALVHAQDKGVMRERLAALDVPCPRHARVADAADVTAFGFPCVLKTIRGGYDGKGVWFVSGPEEAAAALARGRGGRRGSCLRRSWSSSVGSCRPWSSVRRAARRRRTRSSSRCSVTASAAR